jgi:hypothetical protein
VRDHLHVLHVYTCMQGKVPKRKGKRSRHQLVTAGRDAEKSERREQQY